MSISLKNKTFGAVQCPQIEMRLLISDFKISTILRRDLSTNGTASNLVNAALKIWQFVLSFLWRCFTLIQWFCRTAEEIVILKLLFLLDIFPRKRNIQTLGKFVLGCVSLMRHHSQRLLILHVSVIFLSGGSFLLTSWWLVSCHATRIFKRLKVQRRCTLSWYYRCTLTDVFSPETSQCKFRKDKFWLRLWPIFDVSLQSLESHALGTFWNWK